MMMNGQEINELKMQVINMVSPLCIMGDGKKIDHMAIWKFADSMQVREI
jgi:hypothetical protein